jgi:crotonobetainyl-CoA:carnitine CoA-transferase CaiB-like acyl-CoA transferase
MSIFKNSGFGPLQGIKVVDMSTVVAGPGIGKYFADFGADVIKIERPEGDSTRDMGWKEKGESDSLWWKLVNRGKRSLTLDLKKDDHHKRILALLKDADLLIENLRPGKLESLGLAPEKLLELYPHLVIVRVTGFGQSGPYSEKPGFATIAEALSGLSSLMGEPDGGPLLPPIALTDEVTALTGSFAAMMGVFYSKQTGKGQVIDVNLLESVLQILGPLPAAWDSMNYLQPRLGSSIPYSIPRGTYKTADGEWLALSASADSVANRLIETMLGHVDDRFTTFQSRIENRNALEAITKEWIGKHKASEIIKLLNKADAAIAPVQSMDQVVADEHIRARESLVKVDGVLMQNVIARMSLTPGKIRSAGPKLGEHNEELMRGIDEAAT